MPKITLETLDDKTLAYWNMSSTFNGRDSQTPKLTTAEALNTLNNTFAVINPARPLYNKLVRLHSSIIVGGRKTKSKTTATDLQMPKRAQG